MKREITLKTGERKTSVDRSKIRLAVEEVHNGNPNSKGKARVKIAATKLRTKKVQRKTAK